MSKRKREVVIHNGSSNGVDTSKPTAVFAAGKARPYTVSVALPGSIIANAQTHDLKTTLAGHISRALAVFCVDEVIIFDDGTTSGPKGQPRSDEQRGRHHNDHAAHDAESGYTAFSDPSNFLNHVLSYLETPPYLRRGLFPYHPNLKTAGSLPSLDMPHHLRMNEWCPYREGVTIATDTAEHPKDKKHRSKSDSKVVGVSATAGISNPITIELPPGTEALPPNMRVTLKFSPPYTDSPPPSSTIPLLAEAVAPDAPREEGGYYWGYTTRLASSLAAVFEESPYEDGYDYSVGTSERGKPLRDLLDPALGRSNDSKIPKWSHLLIVFGGVAGLETALRNDSTLTANGVEEVSMLFDAWVNLLEGQGSRTIRTEEAVWIGLMGLRGLIDMNGKIWDQER